MLWIDRHLNMGREDICPTMVAKWGTGGGNVPYLLLMEMGDESLGIPYGRNHKGGQADDEKSLSMPEKHGHRQYASDFADGDG